MLHPRQSCNVDTAFTMHIFVKCRRMLPNAGGCCQMLADAAKFIHIFTCIYYATEFTRGLQKASRVVLGIASTSQTKYRKSRCTASPPAHRASPIAYRPPPLRFLRHRLALSALVPKLSLVQAHSCSPASSVDARASVVLSFCRRGRCRRGRCRSRTSASLTCPR